MEQPATGPRPVVLVVDDTPDNLLLIVNLLRDLYRVKVANSGEKALQIVQSGGELDLILLDVMMPGLSGYQVCATLQADPSYRHIPIIFLTALAARDDEQKGFDLGAVDYITKPVSPPILLARVRTHLQLKAAADFLRDQNSYLEQEVARRTAQVMALQDVTILAMASLAETRDNETGNHIRRTQHYVKVLADELASHPRFCAYLTPAQIAVLFKSAPLHDIGKVGIPDRILLKPGQFTAAEFEQMKLHTIMGADAISHAEQALGTEVEFLTCAKQIARSHQEKWDGSGYPDGLAGEQIPIAARLMALSDVYDALISQRVYKPGMTHQQARQIIVQGRGSHFDPDVVDAFIRTEAQFAMIAARFSDTPASGDALDNVAGSTV